MISGNGFAPKLPTFVHLTFYQMSAKLIELATEIIDTNPAGSQLIVNLVKAETGAEILDALENYDSTVLENHTQPVDSEDDGYVSLTDADGTVTYV